MGLKITFLRIQLYPRGQWVKVMSGDYPSDYLNPSWAGGVPLSGVSGQQILMIQHLDWGDPQQNADILLMILWYNELT